MTARHTVHVSQGSRGEWQVVLPGHDEPVRLETLDDARRIAYLSAAHKRPCELIVKDASMRVLEHELIDGAET